MKTAWMFFLLVLATGFGSITYAILDERGLAMFLVILSTLSALIGGFFLMKDGGVKK